MPFAEGKASLGSDLQVRVALGHLAPEFSPHRVVGRAQESSERAGPFVRTRAGALHPGQPDTDRRPEGPVLAVGSFVQKIQHAAEERPVIRVTLAALEIGRLEIPRQRVGGVVERPGMRHRPDHRAAIQHLRGHRQQLVDPHAGELRGDRSEFAADLFRSVRFRVERVELAPGAVDVEQDAVLGTAKGRFEPGRRNGFRGRQNRAAGQ